MEVFRVVFVANHEPTEVEEPGEEAFHFPPAFVPTQRATVLRPGLASISPVWGDQLDATFLAESSIERIAVVGLVAYKPFRRRVGPSPVERGFDEFRLVGRSAGHVCGDRKTSAVCNCHDLGAFAPFGGTNCGAPFFAGANEPSMKVSDRSILPRTQRSSAKALKIASNTPPRTQCWKYRWHVWYGGYRSGRSFHGAPVRNTHRTPFSTSRRSRGGRPRPPGRRLGFGISGPTSSHCACVSSILHGSTLSQTPLRHF